MVLPGLRCISLLISKAWILAEWLPGASKRLDGSIVLSLALGAVISDHFEPRNCKPGCAAYVQLQGRLVEPRCSCG